jgi:hypothetical protein
MQPPLVLARSQQPGHSTCRRCHQHLCPATCPAGYKDDEAGYDMVLARSASRLDADTLAQRTKQLVEAWPESKDRTRLEADVAAGTQ